MTAEVWLKVSDALRKSILVGQSILVSWSIKARRPSQRKTELSANGSASCSAKQQTSHLAQGDGGVFAVLGGKAQLLAEGLHATCHVNAGRQEDEDGRSRARVLQANPPQIPTFKHQKSQRTQNTLALSQPPSLISVSL